MPTLLFPGALPGARVVSADDHLWLHHAFRDASGGLEVHNPALSDPGLLLAALRQRVVSSLQAGEVPLWNPDIYGGAPLLADGQSMVGSPVTWLHVLLPPRGTVVVVVQAVLAQKELRDVEVKISFGIRVDMLWELLGA